jgi:hypothetical protein
VDWRQCQHSGGETVIAKIFKFLCLVLVTTAMAAQVPQPSGAWRQSDLIWTKPPAELQLDQRSAEAAILYFGSNHEFALVYANVIAGPKSEGLSHGDGRVVYLGTWALDDSVLRVEYRLVSRTVAKENEALPGPIERMQPKLKRGFLLFDKKKFQRDQLLDAELGDILKGESARLRRTGQP